MEEQSAEKSYCEKLAYKALEEYLPLRLIYDRLGADGMAKEQPQLLSRMLLISDTLKQHAEKYMTQYAPREVSSIGDHVQAILVDKDFTHSKAAGFMDADGKIRRDLAKKPDILPTEQECIRLAIHALNELVPLREAHILLQTYKEETGIQATMDKLMGKADFIAQATIFRCSNELQWSDMSDDKASRILKTVNRIMDDKDAEISRSMGITPRGAQPSISREFLSVDRD